MDDAQRAAAAFRAVTDFMQEAKLKYETNDEENTAFVTITGDDFPVALLVSVSEEKQCVETYSQLPFAIRKEKTVDIALAIAAINVRIACGKFCLYPDKGLCTFENNEYITGLEGFTPAYGKAVVASAYAVIEEYNDSLYAVNKGMLRVKDFVAALQ